MLSKSEYLYPKEIFISTHDYKPPFIYSLEAVADFMIKLRKTSGLKVFYYTVKGFSNEKYLTKELFFGTIKDEFLNILRHEDTEFISASCDYKKTPVVIGVDLRKSLVYITTRRGFNERELKDILNLY